MEEGREHAESSCARLEPKRAAEMIEQVVEGFYASYLKVKYPNARTREEDLHQLASFAMQFETVDDFLSQLALLTNLEAEDASLLASNEQEFVRLSTVHQAKGQEWRAVFVIGLCDGMFPLARSLDNLEGEEEERRLFYVAVTRAKDELYLTYPLFRMTGGDTGGFQRPSRFRRRSAQDALPGISPPSGGTVARSRFRGESSPLLLTR